MKALYSLYTNPEAAQRAVDSLRRAGIADRDIVVISAEPFEDYEFSHRDKASWIFWIAVGGGALGLSVATVLAYITETFWPLVTGGMPIFTNFPNLIIMFELTMLGAILATVVTLFVTAKLPTLENRIYDIEVSNGKILVAVENPRPDSIDLLQRTFISTGTEAVRSVA